MMSAANAVVQNEGEKIRYERLNQEGITGEDANIAANPMPYTSNILYNSYGGFASFLLPALLILILHQTLFLGIGMEAGSRKEENKYHLLIPANSRRSVIQIVLGKCTGYFLIYFLFSFFILGFIPRFFNLPHIGNFAEIIIMIIPFLLATIFFAMTLSVFMVKRETVLVTFIFSSLILLFISGFSWPRSSINGFWLAFSYIFPSTHGIQAYIKLNTMGANLYDINREYIALWIQTGFYFLTTLLVYTLQITNSRKKVIRVALEKQAQFKRNGERRDLTGL
jgi:ABC-2 type transport system permease protein